MKTSLLAKGLFSARWLLTPFLVSLVGALLALLAKDAMKTYELARGFVSLGEEDIILAALGLVDLTLTASLVVLVIFSAYANFIARIDPDDEHSWPRWMVGIDFSELKLKLLASIVAISGIKLLEAFMNLDHESDRDLGWQAGLFGAFVVGLLLLAVADWIGKRSDRSDEP